MRSYVEPIIAHPDRAAHLRPNGLSQSGLPRSGSHQSGLSGSDRPGSARSGSQSESSSADGPPSAFLWRGRHYAVRSVVATWLDQAPWWRGGQAPVRRCWRVEASAGMASGISVVDLACDADGAWHLLAVID